MKERRVTPKSMSAFLSFMKSEERSEATIDKYMRDIQSFAVFIGEAPLTKQLLVAYKDHLGGSYAATSANSMIAALNTFLRFCGWHELCVKRFRVQRQAYCSEEKELTKAEYVRLVETAKRKGNERLNLILQTICSTGIRVSELQYITVGAVKKGEAFINCKGKNRRIFIVPELRRKLLRYIKAEKIRSGSVFVTRSGRPVCRSCIWREMKGLCKQANVSPQKVFPHNLRHLFARTFYGIERDIAKLADILGHASINTTRVYIITTGSEHRRKMEQLRLIV